MCCPVLANMRNIRRPKNEDAKPKKKKGNEAHPPHTTHFPFLKSHPYEFY